MSPLKSSLVIAIIACASACGRQVVEFKLGEDAGTDGRLDARSDGSTDAPTDGPVGVRPIVTSTTPTSDAANVALNTLVTATFSKPMNAATLTMATFTLRQGTTVLTGAVAMNTAGTSATLTPAAALMPGLIYTATITTGATDTVGLTLLVDYRWMFTAGTTAQPPTVTATTPLSNAMNVAVSVSPTAMFSQPMNSATINTTTFTLAQGATPFTGIVTLDVAGTTATFNPTLDLTAGLVYTATITTGAQDTNGMALAANYVWMFTAGTNMACVVPPIVLGTSGAFAVLAGSTVTNTGPTLVTGDLGVWPGTAITGFPPGILIGTQYAGVTPAMTAQGDLTVAYNDAAGRTLCLVSIVGDLGGLTLPPGLYKSTSFLEITTGDLVLDAQGDPNAVWIFSMAASLTVANTRQVSIIGGGSAANVYWQVGSSAVIGTGVAMMGTIMADQSISFATGAVLKGRALARVAAVTLDSTTVTKP